MAFERVKQGGPPCKIDAGGSCEQAFWYQALLLVEQCAE